MTPLPGPALLVGLPLLAAGVTYLVRRFSFVAALLSMWTTGSLALLCLYLPLDRSAYVLGREIAFGRPIVVAGRTLALTAAGQTWLAFVFILSTVLYLCAWRISPGRSFFPFSLTILSLYALIVLVPTFSWAVLLLAISAALMVLILQAGQPGSIRGAQRYLVVALLAVPFLLAAAWFRDQTVFYPENGDLVRYALLAAGMGFGLWLASFPFSTWMPAMATEAPPVVAGFALSVGQMMAVFVGLSFWRDLPSASDASVLSVIRLAGLVMGCAGGVMAAVQHDFGRLMGYAALSDLGYLLMALGLGSSQGPTLALLHGVNRAAGLTLFAAALSIVRQQAATDQFTRLRGMGRRLPIATVGLMLGGMALAGFPGTAGFPTHWAISRATWNWVQILSPFAQAGGSGEGLATGQEWMWWFTGFALAASSAGIIIGMLRGLSAMLESAPVQEKRRQPLGASLIVLALAALTIILGLYPQWFLEPVQKAVQILF